jgi:nucleoid DNA-binding protein
MREVFKRIAVENNMTIPEVKEIWESQFKTVFKSMEENFCNEEAPKIKLTGFGSFYPNTFQIKKYKEKYNEKHQSRSNVTGITETGN